MKARFAYEKGTAQKGGNGNIRSDQARINDEHSGMDFDSAENLLHRDMLCLYGSQFCPTYFAMHRHSSIKFAFRSYY
jgi:hypothetical protein